MLVFLSRNISANEYQQEIKESYEPKKQAKRACLSEIKVLDLHTAQTIALANNPSLETVKAGIRKAFALKQQASSAYYPQININASVSRVRLASNSLEASSLVSNSSFPANEIENPEDYFSGGIYAEWLLFDGFKREYNYQAAKYGVEEKRKAFQENRRIILSTVASFYFNVLLGRENISISEADEAFYKHQLKEAITRKEVGTGNYNDELGFRALVNNAKSQKLIALKNLQASKIGLAAVLGLENVQIPNHIEFPSLESEDRSETPIDIDALIASAIRNRPDIRQAQEALRQTNALVKASRHSYFPKVSLVGDYSGQRDSKMAFRHDDFGSSLGLYFSYNLFSGGYEHGRMKEAVARREEIIGLLKTLKLEVRSEVKTAVSELLLARDQLLLQRENEIIVRKNRDLIETSYNAGQVSFVRLQDAQRALITAQGNLARAVVSLKKTKHDLETATGNSILSFNE